MSDQEGGFMGLRRMESEAALQTLNLDFSLYLFLIFLPLLGLYYAES